MAWSYEYSPYLWPILTSAALSVFLGSYALRHRAAPGAVPVVVLAVLEFMWVLASALRLASTEDATKFFWFKLETACVLPMISAALCFAIDYAGLGRLLTRRALLSLAVVPLIFVLLIITNETHHLVWTRIRLDGMLRPEPGPADLGAIVYGYFLSLLYLMVLVWLFLRSPRHRWITAGLIVGPLCLIGASFLYYQRLNPFEPVNLLVIVLNLALLPFALPILRFRVFDAVPVAHEMAIQGIDDGMIVLDLENHIADINGVAEKHLGVIKSKVLGVHATQALSAYPDLLSLLRNSEAGLDELPLGNDNSVWVQVNVSPLRDRRGFHVGRLMWLHDMTKQRQDRLKILDQQKSIAIMKERELLGRELHDGIGQMLAATNLQIKSASELLARGEIPLVEEHLRRIAEMTQASKEAVREYLLGVKDQSPADESFSSMLRSRLHNFSRDYGIHADLLVPSELDEPGIDSMVKAQLQLIIQEALTNVRKHSGASSVRLTFALDGVQMNLSIEDNGRGFDLEGLGQVRGFGLRSMRGRAESVGAKFVLNSKQGNGTQIIIRVPWQKEVP